jgi:hypothetical protein
MQSRLELDESVRMSRRARHSPGSREPVGSKAGAPITGTGCDVTTFGLSIGVK